MRIVIIFTNIGSYHAARLRAAQDIFSDYDWELIAVQVSNSTFEHPWGDLSKEITFPLETVIVDEENLTRYSKKDWKRVRAGMREKLEYLAPDVVFIPGWGFPIVNTVLKWCKKKSARVVLMSESKKDDLKRNFVKELIKKVFYINKFNSALVGGKIHTDYLIELGMPKEKIFTGYDVIDNDYFIESTFFFRNSKENLLKKYLSLCSNPYYLTITRFMPRKNLLGLISAYIEYRKNIKDNAYDLVICGSGEQRDDILKYISDAGLVDSVHLPGFVSYQDIPLLLSHASALIHPAFQEQWGLVINEACAASLPILCSNTVGSSTELVNDSVNGFLFNPSDIKDIEKTMLKFHNLSQVEQCNMGLASLNIIKNYGAEKFGLGAVAAIKAALS